MYYYGMVFNAAHVLALNRLCPRCLDTDSQNPHAPSPHQTECRSEHKSSRREKGVYESVCMKIHIHAP